jgi:hypothetical protein
MDPALAKLTLWHGFTPVLALSAATLVGVPVVQGIARNS